MPRIAIFIAAALLASSQVFGDTYRNKEHGFTVELPAGWQIQPGNSPETLTKAALQDTTGRGAVLAIAAYSSNGATDMWNYTAKELFDQFKVEYPAADAVLTDSGKSIIGGEHALWTRIDVRSPPVAAISTLTYYFIHGNTLFRIGANTTGSDPALFAQHRPAFEAAVATFTFAGPASQPASQPQTIPAAIPGTTPEATDTARISQTRQSKTILVGTATAIAFLAAAYVIARRMRSRFQAAP